MCSFFMTDVVMMCSNPKPADDTIVRAFFIQLFRTVEYW